ncbi:MAG TPA: hypothetical protein VFJ47_11965 [Terriglobales bacterium]|nr:hypothetical protein [Terriglobales bacterium]
MAGTAHNVPQEYWRPPASASADSDMKSTSGLVEACDRCETEFMVGARFCHICGAVRPTVAGATTTRTARLWSWVRHIEFQTIKERLGLSTASLVSFFIGVGCVLAAIIVGLIFTAQTVLDWQAVQVWRIQWLLAAAVAFVAGILLKK